MEEDFVEIYSNWLKKNTFQEKVGTDIWKITTPFLDRHNDFIQIYIKKIGKDRYCLTDDSYVVSDLKASGFEFTTPKRIDLFNSIVRGYGVKYDEEKQELSAEVDLDEIGQRKNDFLQCLFEVSDMFDLVIDMSPFSQIVKKYFDENEVRYSENQRVRGEHYEVRFDFGVVVIKDHLRIQNYITTVNNAGYRAKIESILWSFTEIRRVENYQGLLLFNDEVAELPNRYNKPLEELKVEPISWSERKSILQYVKD